MKIEEFRTRGKDMVDYICNYLHSIYSRRVFSNVQPGYLKSIIPERPPMYPEEWEVIMEDIESKIMPGITHTQHPHFYAHTPTGHSFPSIMAQMLMDSIACMGFSWEASPACTELETIVTDWLGIALGLPEKFLAYGRHSLGGGCIQSSSSECILVSMLTARKQAFKFLQTTNINTSEVALLPRLVAYCSLQAHVFVEKAAKILMVQLRILETDEHGELSGRILQHAVEQDTAKGHVPFYVCATLGSGSTCCFDNLLEIGMTCKSLPSIWLHVDATYAGCGFILPELRPLLNGIRFADSFHTDPSSWLKVHVDCSCFWVRDKVALTCALSPNPSLLREDDIINYSDWQIPSDRKFRALKLWFVVRSYGIEGLRAHVRRHIASAKHFEEMVLADDRFEVMNNVRMGLVCFRLKGPNSMNQTFLSAINQSGRAHLTPTMIKNKYCLRLCFINDHASIRNAEIGWRIINDIAQKVYSRYH